MGSRDDICTVELGSGRMRGVNGSKPSSLGCFTHQRVNLTADERSLIGLRKACSDLSASPRGERRAGSSAARADQLSNRFRPPRYLRRLRLKPRTADQVRLLLILAGFARVDCALCELSPNTRAQVFYAYVNQ